MRPLKRYVFSVWCLWNGHETILGTAYNVYLGRRREVLMCKHCYKVL